MNVDIIKAIFTYLIALVVVVGGMVQIHFLLQAGIISGDAGLAILGPLIGAAISFVFVQENSTRMSRAAERQFTQGSGMTSPTTVTNAESVTTGGPTTVNPTV